MSRQVLVLVALFLALRVTTQYQVSAAALDLTLVPLEMGYGISSLTSVSEGIPVYAPNDEIWVRSTDSATAKVSLISPSTDKPIAEKVLEPTTVTRLYRFTKTDMEGTWQLLFMSYAATITMNSSIPVRLLDPNRHSMAPRLGEIELDNNKIILNVSLNPGSSYDLEAVTVNRETNRTALIQIPPEFGSGFLTLEKKAEKIGISVNGTLSSSLDFWVELYHAYSYSIPGTGGLVSADIMAAASKPVFLAAESLNATTILREKVFPRSGRYVLRSFFRNASGLSMAESRALLTTDGSLISIDPSSLIHTSGSSFSVPSSPYDSYAAWPRGIYVMYRIGGVESLSYLHLDAGISKAVFFASPWGIKLSDMDVNISPNPKTEGMIYLNETLYLVARAFPQQVQYTISLGNETFKSGSLVFSSPFSTQEVTLEVGELSVHVMKSGQNARGAIVELTSDGGGRIIKSTDDNGHVAFHVPQGSYTVRASLGLSIPDSELQQVTVENGRSTSATVTLGTSEENWVLSALLLTTVIGIATNIWIWILRPRVRFRNPR